MALPNLSFLFRSSDDGDSENRRQGDRQSPARGAFKGIPRVRLSGDDTSLCGPEGLQQDNAESLIVSKVRTGDVVAFEALFHMHYLPLVRFLRRYIGLQENAEDVAQDTFAQLWNLRAGLNPSQSFRGYLFKIARNRALNLMHHEKVVQRHVDQVLDELGEAAEESPAPNPGIEVEVADLGRFAEERVARLSPRLREVYRLSREDLLTPREIAQVLGTSVHTVHKQLGKILDVLMPALKRWLQE
jgi:RNA polymerase sigma-70 factor (ECF subfamily)